MIASNTPSTLPALATNAAADIRDIRPPLEIANVWFWVFVALAVLIGLALLAFGIVALIKRAQRVPVVPPLSPDEKARRQLKSAMDLFEQPKPFCILVSDTVRVYLEERFGLRAPERTTDEFLSMLQHDSTLTPTQKSYLEQFLSACDMVKFAKYEPAKSELQGIYSAAMRLVDETAAAETASSSGEGVQVLNR